MTYHLLTTDIIVFDFLGHYLPLSELTDLDLNVDIIVFGFDVSFIAVVFNDRNVFSRHFRAVSHIRLVVLMTYYCSTCHIRLEVI